ncbi:Alpha/beta hydrolase [Cupriavidus sp. H19C3]|uniref:alpha/beta hydrolase family protein n=1 Tax=Cupriavidus sp. H19C3 TaxID=3241603 RepID=UPI003BF8F65B
MRSRTFIGIACASLLALGGCGGGDDTVAQQPAAPGGGSSQPDPPVVQPEEVRAQDSRVFTVNEASLPFAALAATPDTDRWWGVLEGAGYRIEVPRNWNGMLVMYAHGYAGTGAALTGASPTIRAHLVAQGYAWAASSFSRNYYDVRAGVEDTNALALAFVDIARQNGRVLSAPSRTYIVGTSMGGHVAAAAVDAETLETANHKVRYNGAVPMCGVLGDTELYDYFGAYQIAAQQLAGLPVTSWPAANWAQIAPTVQAALFTSFPTATTPQGDKLKAIVKHLTGGERPMFDEGFAGSMTATAWGTFGRDGTINGILNRDGYDTRHIVYQFDSDPALSPVEQVFNDAAYRLTPDPEANRLRRDGLRWFPKTNARIGVPVVTLHTLGDMYVPFSMEQIYKRRALAAGTSQWLVQRAIRGVSHCDFTDAEQVDAFQAMVNWEQNGIKPDGDDVLDAAAVAQPTFGCRFSSTPRTGTCPAI